MAPGTIVDPSHETTNGYINGDPQPHSNGTNTTIHGSTNGDLDGAAPSLSGPPNANGNIDEGIYANSAPDEISDRPVEPVAIIGMAMRLPGVSMTPKASGTFSSTNVMADAECPPIDTISMPGMALASLVTLGHNMATS